MQITEKKNVQVVKSQQWKPTKPWKINSDTSLSDDCAIIKVMSGATIKVSFTDLDH